MKYNTLFVWLFLIILVDTWLSGMLLPVTMQLVSTRELGHFNRIPSILNDSILASGLIVLLSPTYLLASPVIGWLCDVIGRKKSLIICLISVLIGYSLLYISYTLHSILFAFLGILAINADASMIAIQSMIIDSSQGKQRAYYLGLIVLVMLPIYLWSAQTIDFISAISVVNNFTIQGGLIALAFIGTAIVILLTAKWLPNTSVTPVKNDSLFALYYSLRRIMLNKKLILLFITLGVIQFGCGMYFEAIAKYLLFNYNHHADSIKLIDDIGNFVLVFTLIICYPLLLKYSSLNNILILALSLCVVGALGSVITPIFILHLICYSLLSMGEGLGISVIWMMLSEAAHPQDRGLVMGIKGAIWSMAWSFSVTLGHMLDHIFYLDAPLEIAALILFSGVVLVYTQRTSRCEF